MVLTILPMRRNSPRRGRPSVSSSMVWLRSPLATAPMTRATSTVGLDDVADHGVDGFDALVPAAGRSGQTAPLSDASFLADHLRDPVEFPGETLVQLGDVVEGLGDLPVDAGEIRRQAAGEVALAESAHGFEEQPGIKLRSSRLNVWHKAPVTLVRAKPGPDPLLRRCPGRRFRWPLDGTRRNETRFPGPGSRETSQRLCESAIRARAQSRLRPPVPALARMARAMSRVPPRTLCACRKDATDRARTLRKRLEIQKAP
jgi:hypothetical protein